MNPCPYCCGSGRMNRQDCPTCDGEGVVYPNSERNDMSKSDYEDLQESLYDVEGRL